MLYVVIHYQNCTHRHNSLGSELIKNSLYFVEIEAILLNSHKPTSAIFPKPDVLSQPTLTCSNIIHFNGVHLGLPKSPDCVFASCFMFSLRTFHFLLTPHPPPLCSVTCDNN
jgi:hypothetical protein